MSSVSGTQYDVNPFDPELALPWDQGLTGDPLVSEKDAAAPSLAEAADRRLLATYDDCRALYRRNGSAA